MKERSDYQNETLDNLLVYHYELKRKVNAMNEVFSVLDDLQIEYYDELNNALIAIGDELTRRAMLGVDPAEVINKRRKEFDDENRLLRDSKKTWGCGCIRTDGGDLENFKETRGDSFFEVFKVS